VPAQHYTCGGVVVDLDGRTDAPGLYAAGEVTSPACTAPTGWRPTRCSNASSSASPRRSTSTRNWDDLPPPPPIRPGTKAASPHSDEEVVVHHNWREIRRFMWDYVGIVRTTKRLERALNRVDLLRQETEEYYGTSG
jgi:L-aspartate oxidase